MEGEKKGGTSGREREEGGQEGRRDGVHAERDVTHGTEIKRSRNGQLENLSRNEEREGGGHRSTHLQTSDKVCHSSTTVPGTPMYLRPWDGRRNRNAQVQHDGHIDTNKTDNHAQRTMPSTTTTTAHLALVNRSSAFAVPLPPARRRTESASAGFRRGRSRRDAHAADAARFHRRGAAGKAAAPVARGKAALDCGAGQGFETAPRLFFYLFECVVRGDGARVRDIRNRQTSTAYAQQDSRHSYIPKITKITNQSSPYATQQFQS